MSSVEVSVAGKPRATAVVMRELGKRGWKQADLARELKVHSGLVARWLNGERVPSLERAVTMKKLLGVDPSLWLPNGNGNGNGHNGNA